MLLNLFSFLKCVFIPILVLQLQLVVCVVVCCVLLLVLCGLSLPWQLLYIALPAAILFFPTQLLITPSILAVPQKP